MKSLRSLLLVAALAAPFAASADQLGVDFTAPGTVFTNGDWTLGYNFQVTSPVVVTGLAVFNANFDSGPMTVSDDVGLWTSSGTLLTMGTVLAGTPDTLDPYFASVAITPLLLLPGNYVVGAQNQGLNYAFNTIGMSTAPGITYVSDAFQSGFGLSFPGNSSGYTQAVGGAWFGGNIVIGTASAPDSTSTWALGLMGLAGIAAASRLKRATA